MHPSRWLLVLWPALLPAAVPAARAQPNPPHIGYVYPAGGRQGTTFEVKIGGQFLGGVTDAYFSGTGIQVAVLERAKPLTQKEINQLRENLQMLQKKEKDAATLKEIADIRLKLATVNRGANPALAETVTVQVTVAADVAPGPRELRLATPLGLSNPLTFCVGQLPEVCEKEWKPGAKPPAGPADAEIRITLPAIVNGRIIPGDGDLVRFPPRLAQPYAPGDVDRYRFAARQGQQLVVVAEARELIPYLADAVPGWFQAVVTLYDADGKELAYDDDYRFHPDPVLHYVIPRDGEYVIAIRDAIYRGREDFVYRITIGELTFVTSIFPLGGRAGTQTPVELRGWNLPTDKLTMDCRDREPGVYPLSVGEGPQVSNHVPFAVDTLPECLAAEPNDSPEHAQPVTLPVILNGRIDAAGDWDVFRFEGRAGDNLVAEVYARRLDSPLDSVLKLTDATGRQLAFNDDHEDKGSGLNTHHADSLLTAKLETNGTCYIHIGDGQHKGGPEYAYRLRLSAPRPDFALRVVPSALNVRGGASIPLTVYALRRDGFAGEIALALKDAPGSFLLSGARVPAHQDEVRLTLTVPPLATQEPLRLSLEGRATIDGQEVRRPAVPAEDMMQAFAYRHLVPAQELRVAISGRNMARVPVRLVSLQPVKLPAGGTARVQLAAPPRLFVGQVQLELSEPPDGITVQSVTPNRAGAEVVLQSDAAKVKPGLEGNLIANAFIEREPPAGPAKTPANRRRIPLGTLPAMPFEIVSP
jgi:hypothetical protein